MKRGKAPRAILALALASILALSLFGCVPSQDPSPKTEDPGISRTTVSQQDLVAELQAKYGNKDKNEYLPPIDPVARDHTFSFHLNFNPLDFPEYETVYDLIGVYGDSEFTRQVDSKWTTNKISTTEYDIQIAPGEAPAAAIYNSYGPYGNERRISDGFGNMRYLNDKGEHKDWGNLPRYYLVQFVDLNTGKKLEKPLVQVFMVKAELPAPASTLFVDKSGKLSIRWEPVAGAERYVIYSYAHSNSQSPTYYYYSPGKNLDVVDGAVTEWHAANNADFRPFENVAERYFRDEGENGTDIVERSYYQETLGVIAINSKGHSSLDNFHLTMDIANRLFYDIARQSWDKPGRTFAISDFIESYLEAIEEMPAQIPVQMCDGSIVYKTVEYDFADVQVEKKRIYYSESDPLGDDPKYFSEDHEVLKVNFRLPQTDVMGCCYVLEPPATWKGDLTQIKKRQEALSRASDVEEKRKVVQQRSENQEGASKGDPPDKIEVIDTKVFASNALSEYLAINMIAGNEKISLKDFPQASDTQFLTDTLMEAYYQNPLILGVSDMYLDKSYNLIIEYEDAPSSRVKKQSALLRRISEIIPQIITPNMTGIEKEIAINGYLCDTVEYNYELLEEAKKNDYRSVDAKYNDSFTAYGALIDGVCVCSGYAAAFKLLADAAGLEAIVVTGTLEGSIGHAWNRVFVKGEWVSIDPTNNDNPYLYNVLFNLPDDIVAGMLVEDKDYMLDSELSNYYAKDDSAEYYRVIGDFYSKDRIVDELANSLKKDGRALLRTDYTISDSEYKAIVKGVQKKTGADKLYGYHLFGLICLSTEAF